MSGGAVHVAGISSENGNSWDINSDGQGHVVLKGKVDSGNSTTTTLGNGGVFTGMPIETLEFAVITVFVYSDQASATDGLSVQFSSDGTNWDGADVFTIPAATGKTFSFQPQACYMRIVYTNGTTPQTAFRLQTIMKKSYVKPSSHRIADEISDQDDAELVKSALTGADSTGTWHNVQTTPDGNLTISDNSSGLAIAKGDVTGSDFIHKFGAAPDFDETDNEVSITDMADDGAAWENMVYDYSTTADIDSISSSDSADQSLSIEIQGLDTNYNLVTQTATTDGTDGQTRVALSTSLIRVFRMKNITDGTDVSGTIVVYPNTALTNGVPTDKSKIRAAIIDGNNQTEMAIYTVPAGKTAYLRSLFSSTAGANKTSNYIIKLKARPFEQVFQLKHRMSISDTGSSYIRHDYIEPEVFTAKTDIEMTAQMTAGGGSGAAIAAGFDIVLVDD